MKLKRNNHFDGHVKASLASEIGNSIDAAQVEQNYRQKLLETYMRSAPPSLLATNEEIEQVVSKVASASSILGDHMLDASESDVVLPPLAKQKETK
jgi:hypothetical protein